MECNCSKKTGSTLMSFTQCMIEVLGCILATFILLAGIAGCTKTVSIVHENDIRTKQIQTDIQTLSNQNKLILDRLSESDSSAIEHPDNFDWKTKTVSTEPVVRVQ